MSKMWIVGVDEAGRGPVLGPLVTCAFAIPEKDLKMLAKMGVRDSKKLSAAKRQSLATWLRTKAEVRGWQFHIHSSSPASVDRAMQVGTLNEHGVNLFAHCISSLELSDESERGSGKLHLDACDTDAERFGKNVTSLLPGWVWPNWRVESRHGADDIFPIVGAASILAKVERDSAMQEMSESMGENLGSGYPSDPVTISALPMLLSGETPHEDVRWRWATTVEAWSDLGKGAIPHRPPSDDAGPKPAQRTLFE